MKTVWSRQSWIVLTIAGALVVAACSSSHGVSVSDAQRGVDSLTMHPGTRAACPLADARRLLALASAPVRLDGPKTFAVAPVTPGGTMTVEPAVECEFDAKPVSPGNSGETFLSVTAWDSLTLDEYRAQVYSGAIRGPFRLAAGRVYGNCDPSGLGCTASWFADAESLNVTVDCGWPRVTVTACRGVLSRELPIVLAGLAASAD